VSGDYKFAGAVECISLLVNMRSQAQSGSGMQHMSRSFRVVFHKYSNKTYRHFRKMYETADFENTRKILRKNLQKSNEILHLKAVLRDYESENLVYHYVTRNDGMTSIMPL